MEQFVVIWRNNDDSEENMIGIYDDFEKALGVILFDSLKVIKDTDFKDSTMSMDSRRDKLCEYIEIIVKYSNPTNTDIITDFYRIFSTAEFGFEEAEKYGI